MNWNCRNFKYTVLLAKVIVTRSFGCSYIVTICRSWLIHSRRHMEGSHLLLCVAGMQLDTVTYVISLMSRPLDATSVAISTATRPAWEIEITFTYGPWMIGCTTLETENTYHTIHIAVATKYFIMWFTVAAVYSRTMTKQMWCVLKLSSDSVLLDNSV